MTRSQKLSIELSELRGKINERLGVEGMTDEQRSELENWTKRSTDAETEYRAAVVAEGEPETREHEGEADRELRERRELRSKASCARKRA